MTITKGPTVVLDINAASNPTDFGGGQLWEKSGFSSNTIEQSLVIDYADNTDLIFIQSSTGGTNPDKGGTQGDADLNRMNYAGIRQSGMYLRHEEVGWNGSSYLGYNYEFDMDQVYKHNSNGFGHGTQIAMEYAPDGMYIWTDYESLCLDRVENKAQCRKEGYTVGKRLVRFKYQDGKTYIYGDSNLKTFTLTSRIAGLLESSWATVSIDNVNKLLGVKYLNENMNMKCTIFSFSYNSDYPTTKYMSDIIFTELSTFDVPVINWPKASSTGMPVWTGGRDNLVPNGWSIFGDYCYLVYGTAYWEAPVLSGPQTGCLPPGRTNSGQSDWFSPTPEFLSSKGGKIADGKGGYFTKVGNTQIIRYNWKTGEQVKTHTEAAKSLSHREPEGCFMVPQMDSYGNVGALEFHFAFAGGIPGARNWTLMNKFSFC